MGSRIASIMPRRASRISPAFPTARSYNPHFAYRMKFFVPRSDAAYRETNKLARLNYARADFNRVETSNCVSACAGFGRFTCLTKRSIPKCLENSRTPSFVTDWRFLKTFVQFRGYTNAVRTCAWNPLSRGTSENSNTRVCRGCVNVN